MWFLRARPGLAALLLAGGLTLAMAVGFGIADVLRHETLNIGSGTVLDRFSRTHCVQIANCDRYHYVHLRLDHASGTAGVGSDALYDLVGDPPRSLRIEAAQADTFTHRISELRIGGRNYVTYDRGRGILYLLVPLAAIGLISAVMAAIALRGPIAQRMVARTPGRRKLRAAIGVAVAALCVVFAAVGLSGDAYDLGPGTLMKRYATVGGFFAHEGAHIRTSFGVDHRVESPDLYRLLAGRASLPVTVVVDQGEVNGVRYNGRVYSAAAPNWLPLIIIAPLALLLATMAWLNVRALRRARPEPGLFG